MLLRETCHAFRLIMVVFLLPAVPLFAQSTPQPAHERRTIALQAAEAASSGQTVQQSAQKTGQEIHVSADTLTVGDSGRQVEAKGNVEVKRQEMILKADELRLNRETQDAEAKGRVSVDDPQWKMKAEAAQLNLEQETGTIDRGEVFLESSHLSMSGRRMQKFSGQTYHIDEGFFTTCLCESGPPTWKVSAEEIDLRREGEAVLRGGTFYLMDIPILYLPYAYFPLGTARETGFLFPKFGSSNREGFKFEQPFFWAISKSSDATFGVDVESRARVGLFGELRTVMSRDARAEIDAAYFNEGLRKNGSRSVGDPTIADRHIPQDRWSVSANHRHTSPSGWKSYSDIAAFSDDLFLRDIDAFILDSPRERELRSSRYASSRFGLLRNWSDMSLQGDWAFYQDFIQPDKTTLQKTPQILFRGRRALGESPVEFRWRAEGVNYLRREGADGLRLDLRPELFLPFQMFPYLLGSFDLALRETAYHLYQDGGAFDRNHSRELVEIRGKVGSSLGRIYTLDSSYLPKMRHAIEPEISYLFVPRVREREIPIFDGVDRINRRNLLTFSLTNRLWGKFAQGPMAVTEDRDVELVTSPGVGDIREMGNLRLALSYDVDKERKGGDSLSDLDMNLRITPRDYLAVGLDTGLNPGPWQVSQAAVLFSLLDPRPITHRVLDRDFMRPNQIDLTYRFIRRTSLVQLVDNANLTTLSDEKLLHRNILGELGGRAVFHLTDQVLFTYEAGYNTRDGRFTNNRGGIKLLSQCECWTLSFTVNRRTNPDRTNFKFSFDLLGLSSQSRDLFK